MTAVLRRHPALLCVTLAVPLVALLVAMHRERWFPSGDLAQAELHVRGFFRHPPLVGAAGRIGTIEQQGSHPGPAMWVALLPTSLLFARSAYGLMVAMVVLQTVSVVAAVWLARRLGGLALAVAVFGGLVIALHAAGPQFLVQPWNPWAAIVPFLVFLLLVTLVVDRHLAYAPFAVLAGSYCVQCHAGYALLVGGLLGGALVLVVVRWVRDPPAVTARAHPGRAIAWSAVALVVIWIPPVIDQIRRDPGNLRILFDHFGHPDAPAVGLWAAFKAFAGEFNVVGGWAFGPRDPESTPFWPGFVVLLALFVVSFVLSVRRRRPSLVALHAVTAAAMVIGLVSMARVFGDFYDYVFRWVWMITVAAVAAVVTTAWRELQRRRADEPLGAHWLRPAFVAVGTLAVVVAGVAMTVNDATAELPAWRDSRLVGGVSAPVIDALDPDGRYLVRWHDPMSLGGVGFGVLLELERQDLDVGVDPWASAAALPHRVLPEDQASEVLWVVTGQQPIADFRARGDAVELGFFDQRTDAEREESMQLRAELERRLSEIGRDDLIATIDTQYGLAPLVLVEGLVPPDVKELAEDYDALREPIAVFAVPPFSPLYP